MALVEGVTTPDSPSFTAGVVASRKFGTLAALGIELRGSLTANHTEREEVLMVRPGSELHRWLKEHSGQTVRIAVEAAATR